ncbi:hypothetical protein [Streptomyces asiaticus]|uniref:hypothetical protein n=1 Tax=Streptomyces asiaticus TaxID=114695 RepID=UPI003F67A6EE
MTQLAFLLADLPVELLGRMRSDRVLYSRPRHSRRASAGGSPSAGRSSSSRIRPPSLSHPSLRRPTPWQGRRHRLGPSAPTARSALGVGRLPRRTAAGHRRHRHPSSGRPPPWRPQPQASVAAVVAHRRHGRGCGPDLAGIPAQIRPGTHLQKDEADVGVDRSQTPRASRRRPLDLACHRCPHPTPPRPPPRTRPPQTLGTASTQGTPHTSTCPPRISPPPRKDPSAS